jgi:hypothetical protein
MPTNNMEFFFFLNNIYSHILFFANSEMDCVVINGYFPSLTIKSVLNTITEEILGTEDTFSSNTEHVAHILRYVEPEPQVFCPLRNRNRNALRFRNRLDPDPT